MPAAITLKGIYAALIAAAFALVLALLAVQTVRLEGLKIWPISYEGCIARSERLQADLDNVKAAQVVALERAQAAKEQAERQYQDLAEKTDEELELARDDAMDAAERYIAAHRVRPQAAGSPAGGSAAAPGDYGAESGNGPGETPLVASRDFVTVTPDDIRVCTENTVRLESVREWALGLADGGE